MASRWLGPVLEPRLKPGHTLLYDLLYLLVYRVNHQWLTDLGGEMLLVTTSYLRNSTRFQRRLAFWPPQLDFQHQEVLKLNTPARVIL